jgi:hypothetical protein
MIIDHIGAYFIGENTEYWRSIGRFAAPLFFFVSGSVSKYHIKLNIIFYGAFITIGTFMLGYDFSINILLVIVCIKVVLDHWDPSQQSAITLVVVFVLLNFSSFWLMNVIEYGLFGFAYAFCGRMLAMSTHRTLVAYLLAGTIFSQFYKRILFNENLYVAIESLIVAILLFFIIYFFKYKVYNGNYWFKDGILIFSRYSLEIYFWHFLLFEIIYQIIIY